MMIRPYIVPLVAMLSLNGCGIFQSAPPLPKYEQRAYLGQIGMPVQSDVAIIQAPAEHVIWVQMSDPAPSFKWVAPAVNGMQQLVQSAIAPPPAIPAKEAGVRRQFASVHFPFGSASLDAAAAAAIDQLQLGQGTAIGIVGHTDNVGQQMQNQKLSESRAASVKERLVAKGVTAELITATGQGETAPVADNSTPAGRATNRRADITIEGSK